MKEKDQKEKISKKKRNMTPDYIAAMVAHAILIYLFSRLTSWFDFLTESFNALLWLFYISYAAQIVFNFCYIFYNAKWFRAVTQLATNIFSAVIFYSMLVIFPFNLNEANANIVRIIIYVVIFGVSIAILVETVKLVAYLLTQQEELLDER